jgi:hypothetical protein
VNRERRFLWTNEEDDGVVKVSDVDVDLVSFAVLLCLYDVEASGENIPYALCETLVSSSVVCATTSLGRVLDEYGRFHRQVCVELRGCCGARAEQRCVEVKVEVDDEDGTCEQKSYLPVNSPTSPSNRSHMLCNLPRESEV